MTVQIPELRIVDDELWHAVRARRSSAGNGARRSEARDAVQSTPPTPRLSRSLLSGMAVCTTCGGPIAIAGSTRSGPC